MLRTRALSQKMPEMVDDVSYVLTEPSCSGFPGDLFGWVFRVWGLVKNCSACFHIADTMDEN